MNPSRGRRWQSRVAAVPPGSGGSVASRHATCMPKLWRKKISHPVHESVNFFQRAAKPETWSHGRPAGTNVSIGSPLEEIHSIHGHSGRSVAPAALPPKDVALSVVTRPVCEAVLPQRPLSLGPGLLAALTPRSTTADRIPAHETRTPQATRLRRPAVRRAASSPRVPAGLSGGRERRTQPWPTRASATGHESKRPFHGDQVAQGSTRSEPVGIVSSP